MPEQTREQKFLAHFKTLLKAARSHGGKDAKMHVGDAINLIETFERGELDHLLDNSPQKAITGPFYPRKYQ